MPFKFKTLDLPGLVLIKPKVFEDERGFFMETYKKSDFETFGIRSHFVQDNHSKSKQGVLRGLHFQKKPFEQAKLIRCVKGEIFDVVVDLRRDSPTFGKHFSIKLSDENKLMLYIPRGFAHGFQVLSKEAEVIYKVDNKYAPSHESGIIWNDPMLRIDWPIKNPILSEKDKNWPTFQELIERGEI